MSLEATINARWDGFELAVAIKLPTDRITGILGPSGCGKTSLLRCIAGLDKHGDARVAFDRQTWQDARSFVPPHQRGVGIVLQEPTLFDHLRVDGNLTYGWRRSPVRDGDFLERVIAALELAPLLHRRVDRLSGGERQRVALARAIAAQPRLLLLDEPLTGLDEPRKARLIHYIRDVHQRFSLPVVYVSHSLDEMARVADHLIVMKPGRVVAAGGVAEVLTRMDLGLSESPAAEALLHGQVETVGADGIALIRTDAGSFHVVADAAPGAHVRLRIAARDVSITRDAPSHTSILNILPAEIAELKSLGAETLVQLRVRDQTLLARITSRSAQTLELDRGDLVYAQVKGLALLT